MKLTKLLVAAGIALSALGAQAQLVKNGSFEDIVTNAVTSGPSGSGWNTYSTIYGWTGQPTIEVRENVSGVAQEGKKFVELDTTANSKMFQNISITTAGEYLLSFWYSARPGTSSATNGLSYSFGSLLGSVTPSATTGSSNEWKNFTGKVLLSGNTDLTFWAIGSSDSYGTSLDNVSVTAVPEVETYAMMLAGLGLMGTIVRRRKAKAA